MASDIVADDELWARVGIGWASEDSGDGLEITNQSTKRSITELSMTLEPKLLRATRLVEALSGWCKHWDPNSARGDETFDRSRPVDSIDVFLTLGE